MYSVYVYILVMAVVTYLIRMIPLALLKKEITNTWVKSFLYYVPYVTLAVMTFPAILEATGSLISGAAAFAVAVFMAYRGQSLIKVAAAACAAVLCWSCSWFALPFDFFYAGAWGKQGLQKLLRRHLWRL